MDPNAVLSGYGHRHLVETLETLHAGLSDAQSQAANARLIVLLANLVADPSVLREAARMAREGLPAAMEG